MKKIILILIIAFSYVSCKKSLDNNVNDGNTIIPEFVSDINEMVVPDGFDYKTTKNINFKVQLLTNNDEPIKGIRVDFMDKTPEEDGNVLATGISDENGNVNITKELPSYLKEIIINTDFIGLPNNLVGNIQGDQLLAVIGGSVPQKLYSADTKSQLLSFPLGKNANKFSSKLGTWDNNGKPNYLLPTRDVVSSAFLKNVNVSLPERRPVPSFNPEYLSSTKERNLILKELCDVWVTFVAEGTGNQNALMFFIYNKNNKPTNISQIDSFYHIFPNASFNNSGGAMTSGDKVYLGRFGADTCIGFAITTRGWNSTTKKVGMGSNLYTTIKELNPEANPLKAEHVVLLYDNPSERFLIGFEDLYRSGNSSDDDFNDCVIYASANPVKAVTIDNFVPTTQAKDSDGDSVDDLFDEYPNDASRAYNVYYPNQNTFATVAFEDSWPSKGDYDLNDVVVDFQYQAVNDASNKTKDIKAKYKLRAAGGVYKNGFSVEMPFNVSEVSSVTGNSLGLEAGATKAILKVFNNSKSILSSYNTLAGVKYIETDTITSTVTLTNSKSISLGNFNPFIFVDEAGKGRGYEIHLSGQAPTSLVNTAIFGTNSDATTPAKGIYYKTKNNLPFAIAVPERFVYPWEKTQIVLAHIRFASWAQSGGSSYSDWYKNLAGYRDAPKLYVKP